MIAAELRCVEPECRVEFAVSRRQCHAGLRAAVVRCPACRIRRRRRGQAAWIRQKRSLGVCRPKSAPTHAATPVAAVNGAQSYA